MGTTIYTRNNIHKICNILKDEYGLDRHGNPTNPIDDLIYIAISNKTLPKVSSEIYWKLKKAYPSWNNFAYAPPRDIYEIIRPAGLWKKRTAQLQKALIKIKYDFGKISLAHLREWNRDEALKYLITLPGISGKVARCIMLYTLDFKVLPVDAHLNRLALRLGLVNKKRPDQNQELLENLVPTNLHYILHVTAISHGRKVCKPQNPGCLICCIRTYCQYYKNWNK